MSNARSTMPLNVILSLCLLIWTAGPSAAQQAPDPPRERQQEIAIVIHGGAGSIEESRMSEEQQDAYRGKLQEALKAGYAVLKEGGEAPDAVVAAIQVMQESPLFNSARGAVFTHLGLVQLDASIMDGETKAAGAVSAVEHIADPIRLAQLVMHESPHVMLIGEGAEEFALEQGMDLVPNNYFYTDERRRRFLRRLAREPEGGDGAQLNAPTGAAAGSEESHQPPVRTTLNTVGAAALDSDGDLAAGTSTGGTGNKMYGRVGDSPIIGAGTYADNETAAVSATGHGEYFIRGAIAHSISAMMKYGGMSLEEAANTAIHEHLPELGPAHSGGVIALGADGTIVMPYNTPGMFRGYINRAGEMSIEMF